MIRLILACPEGINKLNFGNVSFAKLSLFIPSGQANRRVDKADIFIETYSHILKEKDENIRSGLYFKIKEISLNFYAFNKAKDINERKNIENSINDAFNPIRNNLSYALFVYSIVKDKTLVPFEIFELASSFELNYESKFLFNIILEDFKKKAGEHQFKDVFISGSIANINTLIEDIDTKKSVNKHKDTLEYFKGKLNEMLKEIQKK